MAKRTATAMANVVEHPKAIDPTVEATRLTTKTNFRPYISAIFPHGYAEKARPTMKARINSGIFTSDTGYQIHNHEPTVGKDTEQKKEHGKGASAQGQRTHEMRMELFLKQNQGRATTASRAGS